MKIPVEPGPCGSGLCSFAVARLPPLLDAFAKETEGVRQADDPEYIHRMRVASRRLRAALPLFKPCFAEKQYLRWMREITRITRALGAARDADVQIIYLQKFLKKEAKMAARPGAKPGNRPDPVPAARYLLASLTEQRSRLQHPVIRTLDLLARSGTVDEMQNVLTRHAAEFRAHRRRPPLHAVPMIAAWRIEKRLSTLLSFEPWVSHPEAVAEHHATRIAAKKLRYTLEVFGPLYRGGLSKHLIRVKRIQEILGDLHDCDVWIDKVTTILLKERTLLRSQKVAKRPDPATLASLKIFLAQKEKERRVLYRSFTRYWVMLQRTGIFSDLRGSLDTRRRTRVRPPAPCSREAVLNAVEDRLFAFSNDDRHSRQVTRLALRLFDATKSIHALEDEDRYLLEYAGLLHDIGWQSGQKGHNRRGARMVMADETLPFDIAERIIICLCISLHRGGIDVSSDPLYSLLSPRQKKRALSLASLLRISDGLDYLHNGNAGDILVTLSAGVITIHLAGGADCASERGRAQAKSDLFASTFGTTVVIP